MKTYVSSMYGCVYTQIHLHIYTPTYMYVCIHTTMHIVYMYIYIYREREPVVHDWAPCALKEGASARTLPIAISPPCRAGAMTTFLLVLKGGRGGGTYGCFRKLGAHIMCVYIYIHIHLYVHTHTDACMHACKHTSMHTLAFMA